MKKKKRIAVSLAALVAFACGKTLDVEESNPPPSSPADSGAAADGSPSSVNGDPVEEISPGVLLTCARRRSGKVVCWGLNVRGAIASGGPVQATPCSNGTVNCIPSPTLLGALNDVTKVSVAHGHGCALTKNREVFCFGANEYANLGKGTADIEPHGPTLVPGMDRVLDVSAGLFATCVLREGEGGKSEVWCWGLKNLGLTGELPVNPAQAQQGPIVADPAKIRLLDGAKKVVVAPSHGMACAIDANDHVMCWGANLRGSLGHTPATPPDAVCGAPYGALVNCRIAPTPVSETIAVKDLVVGNHFGCVVTMAEDKVMCWGVNTRKYLGIGGGDATDHPNFEEVRELPAPVTSLSTTDHHICALASTGAVKCWGDDERSGAMGTCSGETACVVVDENERIDRVWAGSAVTYLRRTTDNSILAMGNNHVGQLGRAPGTSGDVACGDAGMCNSTPQPIVFP